MIYAEDLRVGQEFEFGSMTLSEHDILDFAAQWDPLRIHTDVAYAKEGPFGQVIASGLHTLAAYQRMMVDGFGYDIAHKAGRELRLNFRKPVTAGTTLRGRCRITDLALRPERGDARMAMHAEVLDQHDDLVLEIDMEGVILMRPDAT
jgi:acyl dehydratase